MKRRDTQLPRDVSREFLNNRTAASLVLFQDVTPSIPIIQHCPPHRGHQDSKGGKQILASPKTH